MKTFTLAVLLFVAFAAVASAQQAEHGIVLGKEYALSPIPTPLKEATKAKVCGLYFTLTGEATFTYGKVGIVVFTFKDGKDVHMMTMGYDKFITVPDETKAIPTISSSRRLNPKDPIPFHWTVRISKKDLAAAAECIPPPVV